MKRIANSFLMLIIGLMAMAGIAIPVAFAFGQSTETTSVRTKVWPLLAPISSCPGERFSDVCPDDWFYTYVMDLTDRGAISGYTDGTFRPDNAITRGQVMKVVVIANGLTAPLPPTPTFADVPLSHPFYQWVEIGVADGVVSGYPCGGSGEPCDSGNRPYFRPGANVVRGQLAKMVSAARGWTPYYPTEATFNDVPLGNAYFGYVERANANGIIGGYTCGGVAEPCPGRYFRPYNTSTRAQTAKIVDGSLPPLTPTPTVTGTPQQPRQLAP